MNVESLAEKREALFLRLLRDRSNDESVKAAARAAVGSVREPLLELGEREWRENFLLEFIQREHAKLHADEPDDHPYEGTRDEPLCTCSSSRCKLTSGQIPTEVRSADSLKEGILNFRRSHNRGPHGGEPKVLKEALEARQERAAKVLDVLEIVCIALQHDRHVLDVDGAEAALPDDHEVPAPGEAEPDPGPDIDASALEG